MIGKDLNEVARQPARVCNDEGCHGPHVHADDLMLRTVVAFDLDGTLVQNVPFEAYEKDDLAVLESAMPVPHVVAFAKWIRDLGHDLVIVTGRHGRVRVATQKVVDRLGLGPVPIYERASTIFNIDAAVQEKAAHLRAVKAVVLVGDRDDLDGAAARMAGIRFIHVREVARMAGIRFIHVREVLG